MPKITHEKPYDGFEAKLKRLGMEPLMDELRAILTGFELRLLEEVDSNGGAAVRKLIDTRFTRAEGWTKKTTGGVDWTKCKQINGTRVCIGVEVQVSGRSDLVAVDILHLSQAVKRGELDVGVIVVPDDRLAPFLTDRCPSLRQTARHVDEWRVDDFPLALIGFEHDGPGPRLEKQSKAATGSPKEKRAPRSRRAAQLPHPPDESDA